MCYLWDAGMNEEQERQLEFQLRFDANDIDSIREEAKRWKKTAAKYDKLIGEEIKSFNRILHQINDTAHLNFDELRLCVRALGYAYADHATARATANLLLCMAGEETI
jgi:hypothetical protein